jgi:hypothetical protein
VIVVECGSVFSNRICAESGRWPDVALVGMSTVGSIGESENGRRTHYVEEKELLKLKISRTINRQEIAIFDSMLFALDSIRFA